MPSAEVRAAKKVEVDTASAVLGESHMNLINFLAASILAASPLSKIPKPQMPPHSSAGEPSAVGKFM